MNGKRLSVKCSLIILVLILFFQSSILSGSAQGIQIYSDAAPEAVELLQEATEKWKKAGCLSGCHYPGENCGLKLLNWQKKL